MISKMNWFVLNVKINITIMVKNVYKVILIIVNCI